VSLTYPVFFHELKLKYKSSRFFFIFLFSKSNLLGESNISCIFSIILHFSSESIFSFISISVIPVSHWDVLRSWSYFCTTSSVWFSAAWLAVYCYCVRASRKVQLHKRFWRSPVFESRVFPSSSVYCVMSWHGSTSWVKFSISISQPPKVWTIWRAPSSFSILLHKTNSWMSFSWRNYVVSFHHWEACWMKSIDISLTWSGVGAVWWSPSLLSILLHKTNSWMSFSWRNYVVSFHHWEACWMEPIDISLTGSGIWTVWWSPFLLCSFLHKTSSGITWIVVLWENLSWFITIWGFTHLLSTPHLYSLSWCH